MGSVRLRTMDEDGRRFPCACHTKPYAWVLTTWGMTAAGKSTDAYATIPIPDDLQPGTRLIAYLFENAFDTLEDVFTHPELY